MGAFFDSIHIRTGDAGAVQKALNSVRNLQPCKFWLGPAINGWVSLFPDDNGRSEDVILAFAKRLPLDIFHFTVHDDDIFSYDFYRGGKLVDQYNSCPDYFDENADEDASPGNPELFQDLLPNPKDLAKLKSILAADTERFSHFESQRMSAFVELLGVPNAMSSYDYFQQGERDEIEGQDKFIHIARQPDPAESFIASAQAKREAGDLNGALADFNQAIQLNPNHADAHHGRGRAKRAKGDLDGAIADYSRAIELDPGVAAAYSNRGLARKDKGDVAGALADFNKAIELSPDLSAAYSNRGQIKHAQRDWDAALTDFNKAIELDPQSSASHNNRAETRRLKGDAEGALADYGRAIELNPNSAAAFSNRGELKRMKRDFSGALADFDRAIELKPNSPITYNNRGITKKSVGDLDGALADFGKAIELKPGVPLFHGNRGEVFRLKNDLDAALAEYDKALGLKPDWPELYNNRGEVKRLKCDFDGALADYNKAIELKPAFATAYNNRCLARHGKGDFEGALADYNKAIELAPEIANNEVTRRLLKDLKSKKLTSSKAGTSSLPATENALVLRTDFSDEAAWKSVCAAIKNRDAEFPANVDFISDTKYAGLKSDELPPVISKEYPFSFAFIVDHVTLAEAEHPVLVVDLFDKPGRAFRVIVSQIGSVENNLSIANMGFSEFAEAADKDGIFRGF